MDQHTQDITAHYLRRNNITPYNHPIAADVFAGDGSMAFLLSQEGWNPSDITCFDQAVSRKPLVPGVNWRYWNLATLADALDNNVTLPPEVEMCRGKFDLAISLQSLQLDSGLTVCRFLVKPQGKIITD